MPHKNDNGEWIVPKRTQWAIIVFIIVSLASWGWVASERLKAKGVEDVKTQVEIMAPEVKINTEFRIRADERLENIDWKLELIMKKMGIANPPKQGGN